MGMVNWTGHGYGISWHGCILGHLALAPADARKSQGGCRMCWARSWHPLNDMKARSGGVLDVPKLQHPTVRNRMGVGGLNEATVPPKIGGGSSQPGSRTHLGVQDL